MQRELITRRDLLPHWYVPGAFHFITYRLFGTLPKQRLDELKQMSRKLLESSTPEPIPHSIRAIVHKKLFAVYDRWLDESKENWLSDPRVAAKIRENLYHHHGTKYYLLAYCVMPNHVHVLLQPRSTLSEPEATDTIGESEDAKSPLAEIMHSLKSYTAHEANKILGRSGRFWQSESYDHWVRDEDELVRIVDYIAENPFKAGLVRRLQDWYFCSTHDRFLECDEPLGWLKEIPVTWGRRLACPNRRRRRTSRALFAQASRLCHVT